MRCVLVGIVLSAAVIFCGAQRDAALPLSPDSFKQIFRTFSTPPMGRVPIPEDIIIRHYTQNVTSPTSRRIGNIKLFLNDPDFDLNRPTVFYAHGYLEEYRDISIVTVMSAYLQRRGYNVMLLDWSNLAFGNYIRIAKSLPKAGKQVGNSILKLLKQGLSLQGLHLVGHSMGCHLMSYVARYLDARGFTVPRLSALDPAYPLYYLPIVAPHISASDANFVDVIHTDGGYFGTPTKTGHADFWPNGGLAKQPGCIGATLPFTIEDFCSHWRSWQYWAESLNNPGLLARRCFDYDTFLRGDCANEPIVSMGVDASPDLRGNFYLRTAASSPYGLGMRGVS